MSYNEMKPANKDLIPRIENRAIDSRAVDVGTVRRTRVLEGQLVLFPVEGAMVSGDRYVVEEDIRLRVPTYGRLAGRKNISHPSLGPTLDDQCKTRYTLDRGGLVGCHGGVLIPRQWNVSDRRVRLEVRTTLRTRTDTGFKLN